MHFCQQFVYHYWLTATLHDYGLIIDFTNNRFACANPHVLVEAGRLTKALATQSTFVRSMFLVDVQDVNS